MKSRVAIIGAGPAGLAAAHAAQGMDYSVRIYAPKEKRRQRGPLLLQRPIPGITLSHPDGFIRQRVVGGTILDYRAKLYNDINININGDVLEKGYHAWRMQETYDKLWEMYAHHIIDVTLTAPMLKDLVTDDRIQLVVNTAPMNAFCERPGEHVFSFKAVKMIHEAMDEVGMNEIVFNARPEDNWVRSSRIFGIESTEYKDGTAPHEAIEITKPLNTTCDCHPMVLRTGRFGAWKNETWVDTAYYNTREGLM